MEDGRARGGGVRVAMIAGVFLAMLWVAAAAVAQVSERAEPVTGPGVTTIGGISTTARINVRSGPSVVFPVVGTLGYGTRVTKGICIGGGSARWCEVKTLDGKVSGFVAGRFLVEGSAPTPDDDLAGGPDYWAVRGLAANERLGVRMEPKSGAGVLATLKNGEIVTNLGCRMTGATRWCRIRSTTGMDVTGWVAARYLRESAPPPAVMPPGSGDGGSGPGVYVVRGLAAGDFLNVRTRPSTQGDIIARLSSGTRVRNLGCEQSGQTRWCRIRTTGDVTVTGWVNGRYLREG
ncbi:MAG: SH3 domain-containing protein [Tabrizicola sp.]|uniref:SH3 domain-containing protein n=1 Tax=Tabrizicola sp. TaxID=2005166 RepID=UPI002734F77F|nr:SH3 domain-containing protein [Tabrizicola sp.]MDP3262736.1 SH3 domain-containing protein [Tabrizicola sp.]MDP3648932.1 SH3 domain-containing protein [Paracoccaceae bacterium]MDZ4066374.1 SH3 domain-containing protein [Tabrizicola sp.]